MSLAPGTRLGPHEVVALVGAGGMGEVYRARDTKLARDIALKILPDAFAYDADRLHRFRREAHVLASLNHPNIAQIYGFEEAEGLHALVMELVDGPTLADRIARGQIPVDEALPIAKQIADALEEAHEQGIIHRDLKPANIKVRDNGTVKVLDFGLAKAIEPAGANHVDVSQSPTITSPAMTHMGMILGTAAYMSPEQARGRPIDKRTDIWAFGCVLYEMLTGLRAFGGDGLTDTLAAIVRAEPEWTHLPRETPHSVRRLLRRCLEKDCNRRLADIRDARLEIDDVEHAAEPARAVGRGSERLAWSAALLLMAAVAAAALVRSRSEVTSFLTSEIRLDIVTPPTTDPVSFDISPDGRHVVFVASSNGQPVLWLRSLESDSARPLAGTNGASFPFWSPDGRSIGFFSAERLLRMDIDGGAPAPVTFAPVGTGATWNRDGIILYPTVPDSPLFRISADGGEQRLVPRPKSALVGGERYPQWLPDGRHYLYYSAESRGVFLGTLDGPERRRLLDADAAAVFAAPEHLLFVLDGTLFMQALDPERLELRGERSPLADGVAVDRGRGKAAIAASSNGIVVYRTGASDQHRQLVWIDRQGRRGESIGEPDRAVPLNPALSPDGRRLALNRSLDGNTDIWLNEIGRDGLARFTSDALPEIVPVWSPDGSSLLFAQLGRPGAVLQVKPLNSGPSQTLLQLSNPAAGGIPLSWSQDGRIILFRSRDAKTGWDIWALDRQTTGAPTPIVQTPFEDRTGQLSPDGRWLLYESNDSGRFEIYLQRFPVGNRSPVSNTGGSQPRWRADGREVYYVAPDGYLMSVAMTHSADSRVDIGTPTRLFQAPVEGSVQGGIAHTYTPSLDGQRFLMTTFVEQPSAPLTVLLHQVPREQR